MVTIREVSDPMTRPDFPADQLQRIRVLLLRHQAAAAGEPSPSSIQPYSSLEYRIQSSASG